MGRLGFMPDHTNKNSAIAVGYNGCDIYLNGDTDTHAGNWKCFVVLADVTINAIVESSVVASTVPTASVIPAGTFVSTDGVFTSIDLTSGSVVMYRA